MENPTTGVTVDGVEVAVAVALPSLGRVRAVGGVPFTPLAVEGCIWLDGLAAAATPLVGFGEARFCKLPDGRTPLAGSFFVPA